jgi:predicted phage terminase large subunit-like protein
VSTQKGKRRALFLLPRGHLKSTEITISYVLQILAGNPDSRVLITNALLDNSKGFLREIKGHMEKNEMFRALFGDMVNQEDKWSETQIVVKTRRAFYKEPSIQVTSVDKSVVSQHYDLIIADDVVNREGVSTKEQRQKTIKYYKDLLDLLEPEGMLLVVGTRWHYDDLYGFLLKENKKNDSFDVMVKKVWIREGVPLFPQKFTAKYITELKDQKGPYEFNCQYNNEVVSEEDAEFRKDRFVFFDAAQYDFNQGQVFISIDPALSKADVSDYSGIVVNHVIEGKWYIRQAYHAKLNPTELVDEIFYLRRKYGRQLAKIGIEDIMFTSALDYDITRRMKETNDWFHIEKIKHKNRNKEDRIRAIIPLFERDNIVLAEGHTIDLLEELEQFPSGEHDDVLDALAYQLDIVRATTNFTQGTIKAKQFYQPVFPKY